MQIWLIENERHQLFRPLTAATGLTEKSGQALFYPACVSDLCE